MNFKLTGIQGLIVFEKDIFIDDRGYFFEAYNKSWFELLKLNIDFWQDNISFSKKGVLRGLHFQKEPFAQDKFVQVIIGEVFDVAVDLRKDSRTFGKWHAEVLSESNKKVMFIPKGFAHGFLVLSNEAIFNYKCSNKYSKEDSVTINWNDKDLNIFWPKNPSLISEQDKKGISFKEFKGE